MIGEGKPRAHARATDDDWEEIPGIERIQMAELSDTITRVGQQIAEAFTPALTHMNEVVLSVAAQLKAFSSIFALFDLPVCTCCEEWFADPDRLEPELCTSCNEVRFWRVAGAVMSLVVLLAGVAMVLR